MKIFLTLILVLTLLSGCGLTEYFDKDNQDDTITSEEMFENFSKNLKIETGGDAITFKVKVVETSAEREQGLMFYEEMPAGNGMLFIFEESGRHPFWMKNTLIPLDMLFIDENYQIVDMVKFAMPCEKVKCDIYYPEKEIKYVVEINGGLSDSLGISLGDRITF